VVEGKEMPKCSFCGKEEPLLFKCKYCGKFYCVEHRLPEKHECPMLRVYEPITVLRETKPVVEEPEIVIKRGSRSPLAMVFSFSEMEKRDLAVASFAVLLTTVSILFIPPYGLSVTPWYYLAFVLFFLASFLLHEMMHKYLAIRYGYYAEFKIDGTGLLLTLISALFPYVKIIAPGTVVVSSLSSSFSRESTGKIGLAGPASNVVLSLVFLAAYLLLPSPASLLCRFMFGLNAFIALFNLLPFGNLDGLKVATWNRGIWAISFVASLVLFLLFLVA